MPERSVVTLALTLTVAGFVAASLALGPAARSAPLVVGIPTLMLMMVALRRDATAAAGAARSGHPQRVVEERKLLGWLILLIALTAIAGVPIGVPLWLGAFLRFRSGESWTTGIIFAGGLMLVLVLAFAALLRISPTSGSLITWLS
jgi:hypothetical protein